MVSAGGKPSHVGGCAGYMRMHLGTWSWGATLHPSQKLENLVELGLESWSPPVVQLEGTCLQVGWPWGAPVPGEGCDGSKFPLIPAPRPRWSCGVVGTGSGICPSPGGSAPQCSPCGTTHWVCCASLLQDIRRSMSPILDVLSTGGLLERSRRRPLGHYGHGDGQGGLGKVGSAAWGESRPSWCPGALHPCAGRAQVGFL